MANSNIVCRTIMDANEVTQQKLGEVLLAELTVTGKLSKQEANALHQKLQQILNEQTNSLVDRVLNVL
jgi:hypothetical protein